MHLLPHDVVTEWKQARDVFSAGSKPADLW
jgi:hypothetical protein